MSYAAEYAAIRSRFDSLWGLAQPKVPVAWPNETFTPPKGAWVRFAIIGGDSRVAGYGSPGANLYRYVGIVDIGVMTPVQFGVPLGSGYGDAIAGFFRGVSIPVGNGTIRFMSTDGQGPTVKSLGLVPDFNATWWKHSVSIPFRRDNFE